MKDFLQTKEQEQKAIEFLKDIICIPEFEHLIENTRSNLRAVLSENEYSVDLLEYAIFLNKTKLQNCKQVIDSEYYDQICAIFNSSLGLYLIEKDSETIKITNEFTKQSYNTEYFDIEPNEKIYVFGRLYKYNGVYILDNFMYLYNELTSVLIKEIKRKYNPLEELDLELSIDEFINNNFPLIRLLIVELKSIVKENISEHYLIDLHYIVKGSVDEKNEFINKYIIKDNHESYLNIDNKVYASVEWQNFKVIYSCNCEEDAFFVENFVSRSYSNLFELTNKSEVTLDNLLDLNS